MPDSTVTIQVVANLVLVATGYLVKKLGLLKRDDGQIVNRLVLYLTLPAVSLWALSTATLTWELLLPPLALFAVALAMCGGGAWIAGRLNLNRAQQGTFVISLCGFMLSLAYPFFQAGYGDEGVRAVAVCDIGNAVAVFAVAYSLSFHYAEGGQITWRRVAAKMAAFPPLYALALGLLLNLARIRLDGLPAQVISTLGQANSPLMLLGLGLYLDLDISLREARVLLIHTLFKYGAGLALAAGLLIVLPLTGSLAAVTFMTPLMPAAMSTLLYAAEQGLDSRLAAMLVSLSMLISLAIVTVTMIWFRTAF